MSRRENAKDDRQAHLAFACPVPLKKRLRRLARDDDSQLGAYVVSVLQQHVEEKERS